MRFISFFAGIGGIDLSLEKVGWMMDFPPEWLNSLLDSSETP